MEQDSPFSTLPGCYVLDGKQRKTTIHVMKNVTRAVHQSVAESVHRICPQGMRCTIEHQETFKQIKDVSLHCES